MLVLDIHGIIEKNYNTSNLNFTVPTPNITGLFPDGELDEITGLNAKVRDPDSPFDGWSLRDFLDGDLKITGANIMQAFENANLTTLRIPLEPALKALLNIDIVPADIAHNFTLVDAFESPKGKFGDTLGNVALVDCHHINRLFESSYQKYFN